MKKGKRKSITNKFCRSRRAFPHEPCSLRSALIRPRTDRPKLKGRVSPTVPSPPIQPLPLELGVLHDVEPVAPDSIKASDTESHRILKRPARPFYYQCDRNYCTLSFFLGRKDGNLQKTSNLQKRYETFAIAFSVRIRWHYQPVQHPAGTFGSSATYPPACRRELARCPCRRI